MTSQFSAQDVLRCDQCEAPVPSLYCIPCQVNLCKDCVEEHVVDESNQHNVVSTKHRLSTHYPEFSSTTEGKMPYKSWILSVIDTGYKELYSVAWLNDEQIWTSGKDKVLKFFNSEGYVVDTFQTKSGNAPSDITVTQTGTVIYADYSAETINEARNAKVYVAIHLLGWKPHGVCISSSGELLVTMDSYDNKQTKVMRYSESLEKQNIQWDNRGQLLYSCGGIKCLDENRNLDICVADYDARAVVVVNATGNLRFKYTGVPSLNKNPFDPVGISTDSHGRILAADCDNNLIHILEQDGPLLGYIDNCDLRAPWGICVDFYDNLYVAENATGRVKKIKYDE